MKHGLGCGDVQRKLREGELTAAVEDHLLACEACAALVVRHLAEEDAPKASEIDALLASVELEIDAERGALVWFRALSTDVRWLLVMGFFSALLLVVAAVLRRPDLADVTASTVAVFGVYALLLGVIVAHGIRPMHRLELDGPRRAVAWAAVLSPVAVALLGHLVPLGRPGPAQHDCFPLGLLIGTLLVGLLRVVDRGAHRSDTAALLSVAAGGLGANLVLLLHCADSRMSHVLPAHAVVGLVLGFIYFGPGRRWQRSDDRR
ncbi:MAG TPA: hypothetical protein VHE30_16115 [Polyangiaceae bacterium]|nr:hypothetical protein [Polyangiaceae bacterium]